MAGAPAQFLKRWDFVDDRGGVDVVSPMSVWPRCSSSRSGWHVVGGWAGGAAPSFRSTSPVTRPPRDRGADDAGGRVGRAGSVLEEVAVPERLVVVQGYDVPSAYTGDPRDAMARSFSLITKAIAGVAEARPDLARGYHVHSVIEAIHHSAERAGWVCPTDL